MQAASRYSMVRVQGPTQRQGLKTAQPPDQHHYHYHYHVSTVHYQCARGTRGQHTSTLAR